MWSRTHSIVCGDEGGDSINAALKDLKVTCDVVTTPPEVACRVFEDNQCCIAVAESKKPPARTKHIAIKHNHLCSLVDDEVMKIKYVDTKK